MKIPAVKKLVETYSLEEITAAEEALAEGLTPSIEIEGEDEGDQLTHAFAAKYILEKMQEGVDMKDALREFTQKVRSSIS
ncbi:MAG: hypothetical protein LPK45_06470 [Bacteroidota bacterium]|nr:hypothetical protein [Bacteroidota bacterium]MDX5430717.1 hypothetical protein [Bacteroidota bacterium]MDX5469464.1 hypothetical protein [Bacteroidota bacterium]